MVLTATLVRTWREGEREQVVVFSDNYSRKTKEVVCRGGSRTRALADSRTPRSRDWGNPAEILIGRPKGNRLIVTRENH